MRSLTTIFSALAFSTALVAALPASAALSRDNSNSRSLHSNTVGKIHSDSKGGGGGHMHNNGIGGVGGHHINHDSGLHHNSKITNSK